jgi:predicted transcriptional regulator of viral defense system
MPTKSSMTTRYLEQHAVFTLDEFLSDVDSSVSESTRYTNLRNAVERDQARRLTRGLYASNMGPYRDRTPRVALVAAKSAPDAVLAYHTALEAHGVAHSVSRRVLFVSGRRVSMFTVDGYRFERVAPPKRLAGTTADTPYAELVRSGDDLVTVTTPERTLVDCLMRLDLAGGLEETLRSVGGFPNMDSERVAEYVSALRSPTAASRAGWLLELGRRMWHVSESDLDRLRTMAGRGPHRLTPGSTLPTEFIAAWRLYAPSGLPYEQWIRS